MSIQQHAIDLYDKFVDGLENRAYSMQEWNTLADAFLDKHVPRTQKRRLVIDAFYDHKEACLMDDTGLTPEQLTTAENLGGI